MSLDRVAEALLSGLTQGLLFALISLGFMLIVGVMQVINLAHGALFALGAYAAMAVSGGVTGAVAAQSASPGRWLLGLLAGAAAAAAGGVALERGMRRTYGKDPLFGLLFSFGGALVIEEAIRMAWGSGNYALPMLQGTSGSFVLGGLKFPIYHVFAAACALTLIGALWIFLNRTRTGTVIQAGAHDAEIVRALGFDLARLRTLVFALGTALAGVAGVVLVPLWGLRPHVGVDVVIPAFAIIVLGGVGSFWGAVLGGLLVGFAREAVGLWRHDAAELVPYVLLIAVVSLRSRGLLGRSTVLER